MHGYNTRRLDAYLQVISHNRLLEEAKKNLDLWTLNGLWMHAYLINKKLKSERPSQLFENVYALSDQIIEML